MDRQILQPDVESLDPDMESGEELQIEVQTLENLRVEIAKAQKKLENLNRQIGNEDTENEVGENAQFRNRDGNSSSENFEQNVRSFENTQRGEDRDGEIGGGSGDDRDGEIGGGGSGDDRDGEIGGGSGEDRDGNIGGGRGEGRDGDRNGGRREDRDGDRRGVRGNSGEIGVQQNGGRFETSGLLSPGFNMAWEIFH
nr:RNA-binding protein cabeza-like [Drosophila kikkawai]